MDALKHKTRSEDEQRCIEMLNGSMKKESSIGKMAVVIGAGVSGLCAARALADHFEEVILLERDELPSESVPRSGVPQGRQAHGILGGAVKALQELFPGFEQDLIAAGALPVNPGCDALLEFSHLDSFPRQEWDWLTYGLSRPAIELTIRRRVERLKNVTFRNGTIALKILGTPDGSSVTGVRYQTAENEPETIAADVVVDASRHGALTLAFLKSAGWPIPMETRMGIDIRYATALYRLAPGATGDFKVIVTFPKAPEEVRFGYLLAVEGGYFQLLLVGRGEDAPPADGDAFLRYARELRTPTIHNALQGAERLSEVARYSFPESKWRHFGKLDRSPCGLLPIGDALCLLNPIYGQGITLACQEASLLLSLLSKHGAGKSSLAKLTREFLTKAEDLLIAPWGISAVPDFIYPQTRGARPKDLQKKLESMGALDLLASRDAHVCQLLAEVRHLLKPMSVLEDPEVVRKLEEQTATV